MAEYLKTSQKWNNDSYIFLNEKGQPYVPNLLCKKMSTFINKYKLEHLTVYSLRHSFATLCSTLGMSPEVLHVIMGHTDFETTRKYYIHISEERKRNEMIRMYKQQSTEAELKKLERENELYYNRIISLNIQDIVPNGIAC